MIAWAVVPAAGRGDRLGGVAKALLPAAGGATFLAAIVAAAGAAGVPAARVVVVVGAPHGGAVAAEAARRGARVAVNPAPARGMGSSVAAGFAALPAGAGEVALLWPVDHPAVAPDTVARLLAAARDADVVAPRHAGRGGHPVAVAAAAWAALAAGAAGAGGARAVLADPRWRRGDLAVDDPGVIRDVDTAAELAGRW